jgi:hypothetical protein
MKIKDIILEAKDDFDWEEDDAPPADADSDKVKHLVMQLRSALDVDGNYAISFKDGSKAKLPVNHINMFLKKYETLKPADKEKLQTIAGQSKVDFYQALKSFTGEKRPQDAYSPDIRSRQGGFTQYT